MIAAAAENHEPLYLSRIPTGACVETASPPPLRPHSSARSCAMAQTISLGALLTGLCPRQRHPAGQKDSMAFRSWRLARASTPFGTRLRACFFSI
jgi:hypothetical protein